MNLLNFLIALTIAPFKVYAVGKKSPQHTLSEAKSVAAECLKILNQKENSMRGIAEADREAEEKSVKPTLKRVWVVSIESEGELVEVVGSMRLVRLSSQEHGWYEEDDVVEISN